MPDLQAMDALIRTASRKTLILDSNLLVLWITGRIGINPENSFKRVRNYTAQDVRLLGWIMGRFGKVVTTSAVLAEASNLANELSGLLRVRWYVGLQNFASLTDESHVATQEVGKMQELVRFGFTDAVLSSLCRSHVLITAEYRLAGYLEDAGFDVINFSSLRALWQLEQSQS